jgi:hypothetical protein
MPDLNGSGNGGQHQTSSRPRAGPARLVGLTSDRCLVLRHGIDQMVVAQTVVKEPLL